MQHEGVRQCCWTMLSGGRKRRGREVGDRCEKVLRRQVVSHSLQPMDCSPPASSIHGILQARILEWVSKPFSTGSSQPGIEPGSPALRAGSLPSEPPGKPKRWRGAFQTMSGILVKKQTSHVCSAERFVASEVGFLSHLHLTQHPLNTVTMRDIIIHRKSSWTSL